MNETLTFTLEQALPDRDAALQNQGIPPGTPLQAETEALFKRAMTLFAELANPAGIFADISKADFEDVFQGEGFNEFSTPVADIFPQADRLALFAATLGQPIGDRIKELFASNDPACASMLDAAASAGADRLVDLIERRYLDALAAEEGPKPATAVLSYSPGYCGWHLTGQTKLFEFLHPEGIGITLNDSDLMQPLKSVSGVLIAGSKEIHDFQNSYAFCSLCETHGCRERMPKTLLG